MSEATFGRLDEKLAALESRLRADFNKAFSMFGLGFAGLLIASLGLLFAALQTWPPGMG